MNGTIQIMLTEKYFILNALGNCRLLNKKSEFVNKCRHENKLLNIKDSKDWSLWHDILCKFVYLFSYVYVYLKIVFNMKLWVVYFTSVIFYLTYVEYIYIYIYINFR